ncbi:MAG: hypothetical protein AB7F86_10235 [Bdellovibrionales bacterium]
MIARYVSQDTDWTESMKSAVRDRIIEPVRHHLANENFEISVHLGVERKRMASRKPKFELWVVLQTFDGQGNKIVRREGETFMKLVHDVGSTLKNQVDRTKRKAQNRHPHHSSLSLVSQNMAIEESV